MSIIGDNILRVREKIAASCARSGRSEDDVTLIGVTKTQTVETINESIVCGITHIGENRVQELIEKYDALTQGVHVHLIGHLQTNKVRYALPKAELIHSVDSAHLADEISKTAVSMGITAHALVQVNVSGEESKFGIPPENLDELLEHISSLNGIKIHGLMTIPPINDGNIEKSRKVFETLYNIFIDKQQKKYDNIIMEHLSMGMSDDFETAIESGATMVRIGRYIYGRRN